MQVITSLDQISLTEQSAVALGNFDGIHIGHSSILEGALLYAKNNGVRSVCYTFSNHPVNFFKERSGKTDNLLKLICTEEEKLRLLEEMGFDIVVNVEFNDHIADMRAFDFIKGILKDKLKAAAVFCGFNYSFGVKAEGNVNYLEQECAKLGIEVSVHDAVKLDGKVVSSTLIRKLIADGQIEFLNKCLGRPYSISGTIVHGNHIGNRIGFPTMNILAPNELVMPPNGVYFTTAEIDGISYDAVTNIGVKPTVGENAKSVETNLHSFDRDTYGEEMRVFFFEWERPEIKFESIEALRDRIEIDCKLAWDFHAKNRNK